MRKIGIIGGSGLDDPEILKDPRDQETNTPYGRPSSGLRGGTINGVAVVLLARHGRAHTIPPSQVNYRANLWALKEAGCSAVIATSAVGSLREQIQRGDLVILDQFIDFTRSRALSFHEHFLPGTPVHTAMAEPFDAQLRDALIAAAEGRGLRYHPAGTVVTIEGPRFSTRAESHMFRAWGADVINMSIAPEAALCNELGIPYAAVAMSTDYDCWKQDEPPVSWEEILRVFSENACNVTGLLTDTILRLRESNSP